MIKSILIILHSEASTPGRIGHMLVEKGFRLDIRRPCLGDDLPTSMEQHAGAVIFGGLMSANDGDDWIAREIDWIGTPLRERTLFLGVCLGAQMLACHLGSPVYPHADGHAEIRKWIDPRTKQPVKYYEMPLNVLSANNRDLIWLSDRTSVRLQ